MKKIAFILALVIFGTSLKATAFVGSLAQVIPIESFCEMSCHASADEEQATCHQNGEEGDSCCGDYDCACTCCLHIAVVNSFADLSFAVDVFGEKIFSADNKYNFEYLKAQFHPPIV